MVGSGIMIGDWTWDRWLVGKGGLAGCELSAENSRGQGRRRRRRRASKRGMSLDNFFFSGDEHWERIERTGRGKRMKETINGDGVWGSATVILITGYYLPRGGMEI